MKLQYHLCMNNIKCTYYITCLLIIGFQEGKKWYLVILLKHKYSLM